MAVSTVASRSSQAGSGRVYNSRRSEIGARVAGCQGGWQSGWLDEAGRSQHGVKLAQMSR